MLTCVLLYLLCARNRTYLCAFVCVCIWRKIGLGALALNTNIFAFSFYIFNFLATVPTPFVASARARGDADLASRCAVLPENTHLTCTARFLFFDGVGDTSCLYVSLCFGWPVFRAGCLSRV